MVNPERDFITAALCGRIMRNELEKDAESLAKAISIQTGIPLETCVPILVEVADDAMNMALVMSIPKPKINEIGKCRECGDQIYSNRAGEICFRCYEGGK